MSLISDTHSSWTTSIVLLQNIINIFSICTPSNFSTRGQIKHGLLVQTNTQLGRLSLNQRLWQNLSSFKAETKFKQVTTTPACTDVWQTDRQTYRQTDRQRDRQTDRQTDSRNSLQAVVQRNNWLFSSQHLHGLYHISPASVVTTSPVTSYVCSQSVVTTQLITTAPHV